MRQPSVERILVILILKLLGQLHVACCEWLRTLGSTRRTRTWFMVEAADPTRVWFGTAIRAGRGGRVPVAFRALMPFHRLYSRALLRSAVRKLLQGNVPEAPPRKT